MSSDGCHTKIRRSRIGADHQRAEHQALIGAHDALVPGRSTGLIYGWGSIHYGGVSWRSSGGEKSNFS